MLLEKHQLTNKSRKEITAVIQQAIDACSENEGGRVAIPSGIYEISTLHMRSNVELHLSAGTVLAGGKSPEDYEDFKADGFRSELCPENTAKVLISAVDCENIAITGTGKIDGSGPFFYDRENSKDKTFYSKPSLARPRMIMFYRCRNVRIEDSSFIDSPCWTMWLISCEHVNIHRIKIIGDQKMINNDGLDIDACKNVTVSDSFFQTGDDCIILRAIQQMQEAPAICENVVVNNCVLNSNCQGIRVGCPGDNIIRNCTISNIVFAGRGVCIHVENPARYLPENSPTVMDLQNIMFDNFAVTSGAAAIRVFIEEGIELKRLSGLTFANFRGEAKAPCSLIGSSKTKLRDIRLSNVSLKTGGESAIICRNCEGLKLDNVELSHTDGE